MVEKEKQAAAAEKGYLKAIGLAFAIGLAGVALWVIIGGLLQFISAWIAFIIIFGIKFGYEKAKGPKKYKLAIIITIYFVQIFIAVYLMYYLIILNYFHIGFFEVLGFIAHPDILPYMITEYILIAVFTVIGLVFFLFYHFRDERQKAGVAAKPGKRFQKNIAYTGDFEQLSVKINSLLAAEKFVLQNYGEEKVYRSGNGFWAASKYFKYSQTPEGVLIEAFVVIGNRECDLDGFTGSVAKKPLKKFVEKVIGIIEKPQQ